MDHSSPGSVTDTEYRGISKYRRNGKYRIPIPTPNTDTDPALDHSRVFFNYRYGVYTVTMDQFSCEVFYFQLYEWDDISGFSDVKYFVTIESDFLVFTNLIMRTITK